MEKLITIKRHKVESLCKFKIYKWDFSVDGISNKINREGVPAQQLGNF